MLALQAVLERRATEAMVLLIATQVIDGIDGPMARAANVSQRVPKIDGYVLDLVIDFVTCVVVPVAFMYQFVDLPNRLSLGLLGLAAFTAAIWFARTDMMTDDHWFRGFPATWNLVGPSLYLMHANATVAAFVVVVLSVASMTDLPFPHPVRVVWMRPFTLTMTVLWLAALLFEVVAKPHTPHAFSLFLYLGPLTFVALSAGRMLGWDRGSAVAARDE